MFDGKKIVITGGPGTGKSTLIKHIEQHRLPVMHEVSREVTREAQQQGIDQLFVEQPMLFSDKLMEKRKAQYQAATEYKANCFFDRGLPDVVAYLIFANLKVPNAYLEICEKHAYDHVFILPPWKSIYKTDTERYESFEQAERIFECLRATYINFGYRLIELPKVAVEARFDLIIQQLNG